MDITLYELRGLEPGRLEAADRPSSMNGDSYIRVAP
jgi:hypothetical protein